jgi:hypothetical protein
MSDEIIAMIVWLRHFLGWLRDVFSTLEDLILENLSLRQQVLALHAQRSRRQLTMSHKLFGFALRKFWGRWKPPHPGHTQNSLWAGIGLAFGGIGSGFRDPEVPGDESALARKFAL